MELSHDSQPYKVQEHIWQLTNIKFLEFIILIWIVVKMICSISMSTCLRLHGDQQTYAFYIDDAFM